jgi:hypothetical protein
VDQLWADQTFHRWSMTNNNSAKVGVVGIAAAGTGGNIPIFAANGFDITDSGVSGGVVDSSFTVGNATTVNANTCLAAATVTMTGTTTSSTFTDPTPTTDTSTVTGWGSPSAGLLYVIQWPTANTYNYRVCNGTAGNITTSASVTFNIGSK